MFIQRNLKKVGDKTYHSTLLVHNVREGGKVRHKVISNLSSWPEELILGFQSLLKGGKVSKLDDLEHRQGKAYGAIKVINEIAKLLGITQALGKSRPALLCLFMIMGRIITNGSRRYLCHWAEDEAVEEVLKLEKFDEDDLYEALDWISLRQEKIEKNLFQRRGGDAIESLFLYDITSSYLEGQKNELAEYGYNRDGKKGKKQIVIGLLTDQEGVPVSVEIFKGNTQDPQTVLSQIKKLVEKFGVKKAVFVGDRGMIKSKQIEGITGEQWSYITAITKCQIEKLIRDDILQLGLFDEKLCEVESDQIRYVLRKNPTRQKEIENSRKEKIEYINQKIQRKNTYLSEHPKASMDCGLKEIEKIVARLKLTSVFELKSAARQISGRVQTEALAKESRLDGCYVIKTDILASKMKKETIQARYKDLAQVEKAFRTFKTGLLNIRPLFLRKESRTRGYVFICMLSYRITKYIWDQVKDLNHPQKFIYETLDRIQYTIYDVQNESVKILPSNYSKIQNEILSLLKIKFPSHL